MCCIIQTNTSSINLPNFTLSLHIHTVQCEFSTRIQWLYFHRKRVRIDAAIPRILKMNQNPSKSAAFGKKLVRALSTASCCNFVLSIRLRFIGYLLSVSTLLSSTILDYGIALIHIARLKLMNLYKFNTYYESTTIRKRNAQWHLTMGDPGFYTHYHTTEPCAASRRPPNPRRSSNH